MTNQQTLPLATMEDLWPGYTQEALAGICASHDVEPLTAQQMVTQLQVCTGILNDGMRRAYQENNDLTVVKTLLQVQSRLTEIQHSISLRVQDIVNAYSE